MAWHRGRRALGPAVIAVALGAGCGLHEEVDGPDGVAVQAATAPVVVQQTIRAAIGGELIHPSGARLTIPPGGIPADTVVSLRDDGAVATGVGPVIRPLSHRFVVSLSGLRSCSRALLTVDALDPSGAPVDPVRLVVASRDADGDLKLLRNEGATGGVHTSVATALNLCPRAFTPVGATGLSFAGHSAGIAPADFVAQPTILHVPFYSQDNLPWCVPTSAAMVMNQFTNLEGIVANYQLAGADGQAADEGNSYKSILGAMGVAPALFTYVKWDADLIPSAPFTDYVKQILSGINPASTRGLGMSSKSTSHAFVGVGANNDSIWLHDPSGAFAGDDDIAIQMSWADFRAKALVAASSTELATLYIDRPLRPAAQLTGSLVLEEGTGTSFTYESAGGAALSRWQWDGALSVNGTYWDDVTGALPDDGDFANRFPRQGAPAKLPGRFAYRASVANVTGVARSYEVRISVETELGNLKQQVIKNILVPAHAWKNHEVSGVLDSFVISTDGDYRLRMELREGGVVLDNKIAKFRVGGLGLTSG